MSKKELSLDELKKIELDILKRFDKLCSENGLEYSLAYGTMLGAVRHKGFIPWDDDIDVFMKRADYEKLLSLKFKDNRYEIKSYRYTNDYYYIFSKMVDTTTEICENWRAEKNMGVYIDIFPVDYIDFSENDEIRNIQMNKETSKLSRYVTFAGILGHKLSHHKQFSLRYISKLFIKLATLPIRRSILRKIDLMYVKNKYGNYCFNNYDNIYYKSDLFNEIVYTEFEDFSAPIYKNFDEILTIKYGDYMTPPPVENQKSVHWFKAFKK